MKQMPASTSKKQIEGGPSFDLRSILLLKNWLSVSESQICALEVLCAQIPEVSKLLEHSMCDISERFVAMAAEFEHYSEHTKNQTNIIPPSTDNPGTTTDLVPALHDLKNSLENTPTEILKEKIQQLIVSSEVKEKNLKESEHLMGEFSRNIGNVISRIIVDMQFQDRVSQNLVIVTNVLNAIIGYLQAEINNTITSFDEHNERAELDKEFAQKLLKLLTLGELQHKFMDHLVTHHYISDYSELGYDPNAHPNNKKDGDDIDLF